MIASLRGWHTMCPCHWSNNNLKKEKLCQVKKNLWPKDPIKGKRQWLLELLIKRRFWWILSISTPVNPFMTIQFRYADEICGECSLSIQKKRVSILLGSLFSIYKKPLNFNYSLLINWLIISGSTLSLIYLSIGLAPYWGS